MEHVAIDVGGRQSQICVRDSAGKVVLEARVATVELGGFLASRPPSRVILETCAESFHLADLALAAQHDVRVVPATLARSLGVGARRTKTDRRDALALSEASCRIELPSVHIPSARSREWKTLTGMREAQVRSRTLLINTVRGWLRGRGQALLVRASYSESFPARVRTAIEGLPSHVDRQLTAIADLTVQIRLAERELSKLAEGDPCCRRLMTVPGVGPVTAIRFVAAVDGLDRFASAHHVEAYLGLTPGENSSSDRKQRTSITKAGSPRMRWALTQAAWSAWRTRPNDPMVQWAREIEKRRGRRIAITALARKITGILFALWRDGAEYDPTKGGRPLVAQVPT